MSYFCMNILYVFILYSQNVFVMIKVRFNHSINSIKCPNLSVEQKTMKI